MAVPIPFNPREQQSVIDQRPTLRAMRPNELLSLLRDRVAMIG